MRYDILINKSNPCPSINELDLVLSDSCYKNNIYCEKKTLENWKKFQHKAKQDGFDIDIESSYRPMQTQETIWDDYLKKYGLEYTQKYVATPGYSEHQSGLAIDIFQIIDSEYIFENEMLNKPIEKYIADTVAEYGFIVRYPKGKEQITGYNYEPWHIRYVGKELAQKITKEKIALEEYYQKYK